MLKVIVRPREDLKSALRRLRKLCEKSGLIKELKKHEHYEKPSEKRRRETIKSARREKQSEISKKMSKKSKNIPE